MFLGSAVDWLLKAGGRQLSSLAFHYSTTDFYAGFIDCHVFGYSVSVFIWSQYCLSSFRQD